MTQKPNEAGVDGLEELEEQPVLITTFGPFPGQAHNPTEYIADGLAGDDHVVSHVLDVSYERAADQVDMLVRMVDPSAVVCFGVAGDAVAIRIETLAFNLDAAELPDVDGDIRLYTAIDTGPATLPTRLPVEAIEEALLAAGFPVERSVDPGRYVCNHIFRHVLWSDELEGRPVGFIHLPDLDTVGFSAERVALVGRIVADTVAAASRGEI